MFLLSDCPLPFIMKGEIRMAIHKALKDLNLLDRFLFAEAMEDQRCLRRICLTCRKCMIFF